MALNKVTLVVDVGSGQGYYRGSGAGYFTPSAVLTDAADHLVVDQEPVPVTFGSAAGAPRVQLLATDNAALLPAGWAWTFTPPAGSGMTAFSFFLPFASGSVQYLSAQAPVSSVVTMQAYMPLPAGTPAAGQVPVATGSGETSAWGNGVASVAAADTSVVVGGTASAPTVRTGTLDVIAAAHPPVAAVGVNSQKITGLSSGTASTDAAAFGQTPAGGNTVTVAQGGTGSTVQTPGINPGYPVMLAACKWAFANTDTGVGQKPLTSYTYSNGTAGVGATVTHNSNGALAVDGGSPQAGDRVLVLDPYANGTGAPPHPDGIYTVTSTGSVSTPWVLTRATDCDSAALLGRYWATTITNGTLWAGAFAQVWNLDDQNGGALPFVTGTSFIGLGLSAYTSTALGGGSTAYGGGIAIGPNATATAVLARAVGDTAQAAATYAHAYGPYSVVNSQFGVSLGYQAYVNGIQATGVGDDCNAYGPGMVAFASGRDNTHGDAQGCLQYLNNDTTTATQTTITGASGQQLHFLDYQGNAAYNKTIWLTFTVVARRFDVVGDYAVFTASGALHGDGSSSYAWNGGTPPVFTTAASGGTVTGWAVAASVATNILSVKVTGATGKSISWNCEIRTVEMAH